MFRWITTLAREIRESREGAVAIHMALIFISMLGMVGLATDIGFVLDKHRQMQVAADGAAYSAAIAISTNISTNNPTNITTQADGVAGRASFVNGANSVTITVNNPPATGPNAANQSAVEVIIQQPQTLPLVGLLYSGAFNLGVRAVAIGGAAGGGGGCALQKNSTANPGVTISNGATVDLVGCGLQVCSTATTGNKALSMSGGTHLNFCATQACTSFSTQSASVAGAASVTNGAQINNVGSCTAPTCKTSQGACAATVDPYANVVMPTSGGCSLGTGKSYGYSEGVQTISPGTWCNGVTFGSSAKIKLNPGVYYVNGGNFNVGGAVQMTGTGVTIILTGSGSNYANATVGNGATVTLSAPTSGTTAGLAFVGDPNAPANTPSSSFGGGATMNITGALYFPTEAVQFTNGIANPSGCTQLIAGTMVFNGGASFSNNCAGTGTQPINPSVSTALVE
jgi:Flp pilus assembly protein TadG